MEFARIAEFLNSDHPLVIAHGFTSPLLKQMGESDIQDELRVIIKDSRRCYGYFTFFLADPPVLASVQGLRETRMG